MTFSKPSLIVAAVASLLASAALATNPPSKASAMTTHTSSASVQAPDAHEQVSRRQVTIDGQRAVLVRHERSDKRNAGLGGEHFSTVVGDAGQLQGFANISLDLVGKPLPSRERAEQVARAFLQEVAPDLLPRMEISWIDPHDEPIKVQRAGRAETATLTGMKVKARNLADGRWFWVIVGSDEKPMVFERDIVWISFPGHRKTEKWLHDSWLAQQEPEPSAKLL